MRPEPAVMRLVMFVLPLSIKPPAEPPMESPPVKVLAPESWMMPSPVLLMLAAVDPR